MKIHVSYSFVSNKNWALSWKNNTRNFCTYFFSFSFFSSSSFFRVIKDETLEVFRFSIKYWITLQGILNHRFGQLLSSTINPLYFLSFVPLESKKTKKLNSIESSSFRFKYNNKIPLLFIIRYSRIEFILYSNTHERIVTMKISISSLPIEDWVKIVENFITRR